MRTFIAAFPQSLRRPGLALFALFLLGLVQAAYAADRGSIYTTIDDSAVTNTVTDDGAGTITTRTHTTRSRAVEHQPGDAENRRDAWRHDPNARDFPYDATGGAHRNDLDTARKGFDDPRNPWDGRYANDNPANHPVGSAYDRGEPTTRYRPGEFGTTRIGGDRPRRGGRD